MRAKATLAWVCVCAAVAGAGCSAGRAPLWSSHALPGAAQATSRPSPTQLEEAFQHALALAAELNYAQAKAAFEKLAPEFAAAGNDNRAAQCLFWRGFCLEKLGRSEEAAACYRQVIAGHERAAVAVLARARLSQMQAPRLP